MMEDAQRKKEEATKHETGVTKADQNALGSDLMKGDHPHQCWDLSCSSTASSSSQAGMFDCWDHRFSRSAGLAHGFSRNVEVS